MPPTRVIRYFSSGSTPTDMTSRGLQGMRACWTTSPGLMSSTLISSALPKSSSPVSLGPNPTARTHASQFRTVCQVSAGGERIESDRIKGGCPRQSVGTGGELNGWWPLATPLLNRIPHQPADCLGRCPHRSEKVDALFDPARSK